MPIRVVLAFAVAVQLAVVTAAAAQDKGAPRPCVLLISNTSGHQLSSEPFVDVHAAGFDLAYVNVLGRTEAYEPLAERIPQANVVVMLGTGRGFPDGSINEYDARLFKQLHAFVREGGGLFWLAAQRYHSEFVTPTHFFKPLGVRMGMEYVMNDQAVERTAWAIPFALTTDILPSPVTRDVGRLWYPVYWHERAGSARQCLGIRFEDPAWKVVITGGSASYTVPQTCGIAFVNEQTPEKGYERDVPLFAVREFGKGRMAVSAMSFSYYLGKGLMTTLEGITWDRGTDGKFSHGKQLFINALAWLAEPSMASRGRGSLEHEPDLLVPEDHRDVLPPEDWSARSFSETDMRSAPGLIGVRSAYSTGSGTVAEWKAAAIDAGLQWLAFLEELEHLSREEYEALRGECAELSDDRILLLPGFTYRDFIGMACYNLGAQIPYPPADMLTADGTRFGDGIKQARRNLRGQLSELRMRWQYQVCGTKLMTGWYDFDNTVVPPEDCGQYDTVPVIEVGAKGTDTTGFQVFQKALRDKQYPQPAALHFVNSPAQLRGRLWRTYVQAEDMQALRDWMDSSYGGRMAIEPRHWVSDGPQVLQWEALGSHDYKFANADEFVWQNALRRIRLRAHSPAGIREVRVWDGEKLVRRYAGTGESFTVSMSIDKRDHQHVLFAEIVDGEGHRAVTGAVTSRNHLLQQVNCGDRNNMLGASFQRRRDGSVVKGAYPEATPDKRCDYMSQRPSTFFSEDYRLGLGAFDGAGTAKAAGYPNVSESLHLKIPAAWHQYEHNVTQGKWGEEENGSHHIARNTFAAMDALVGDRFVDAVFADKVDIVHVWNTMWTLKPREYSTWTQRRWVFRPRADEPLAFNLWEYTLTLKKDVTYDTAEPLGLLGPLVSRNGARLWAIGPEGDAIGTVAQGSYGRPAGKPAAQYAFGPGAWVSCVDSPGGGAILFSLTPGARLVPTSTRVPAFQAGLPLELCPTRAGEQVTLRFVVVGIPRYVKGYSDRVAAGDPANTAVAIKTGLGFGCAPGYEIAWQRGEPVQEDFLCRVKAANGVVVASADKVPGLIAPVPVIVEGLNPNWTVMVCHRRERKVRPVGQFEGRAVLMMDPGASRQAFFLGHPVQADHPELVIHTVQTGEGQWSVEMHNPTDNPITAHCRTAPGWKLFSLQQDVTLAPGTSEWLEIEGQTGK